MHEAKSPGTMQNDRSLRARSPRSRSQSPKQDHRKRRQQKRDLSSSPATTSSTESSSFSGSSDQSSDEERRRRDKHRKKSRKQKNRLRSDKERRSKERRRHDIGKKRRRHEDSDEDASIERKKKRKLLKEAKKLLKKHRAKSDTGEEPERVGKALKEEDKISDEDYFLKSNEFATWLKEDKGVYFSSLSSEETHSLFGSFVEIWNAGKLSPKYYDGIKHAARSNHDWAIRRSKDESLDLDMQEEKESARRQEKLSRKKFQKDHEHLLDEILPKATGRERLMEKKALRRDQARAREDSPELMKESDVLGGGDDFQKRLAMERAWKDRKAADRAANLMEKQSAFEEKETAAMNQFKALVNVAGGKITIAKRS